MYIDNENFDKWMERLSKKLSEIGQDLKSLINTDNVLDENDKILDNQDLAFLLKVSFRTLQRYRASGKLPYFTISHKTYYRSADIRAFVQENAQIRCFSKAKSCTNPTHAGGKSATVLPHGSLSPTSRMVKWQAVFTLHRSLRTQRTVS